MQSDDIMGNVKAVSYQKEGPCDGLNENVPTGSDTDWLVTLCVGLGGVALLKEVCHREQALSFSVLKLCFLLVVQDVNSWLPDPTDFGFMVYGGWHLC